MQSSRPSGRSHNQPYEPEWDGLEENPDASRPMQPPEARPLHPLTIYFEERRNAQRAAALAVSAADAEREAQWLGYYANIRARSWAILEAGVERIMTRLRDGIDMKSYMELYTAVHNFCTSQKSMSTIHQGAGQGQRGGKLKTWTFSECGGHVKSRDTETKSSADCHLQHIFWVKISTTTSSHICHNISTASSLERKSSQTKHF